MGPGFSDHSITGASFQSTDEAIRALSGSVGVLGASDALRGLAKSAVATTTKGWMGDERHRSITGASFQSTDEAIRALSGSVGVLGASYALRGLAKSDRDLLAQLATGPPTVGFIDYLKHGGEASIFVPEALSYDDRQAVRPLELLWYSLMTSGVLLAAVWIKLGSENRSPEQVIEGMYWLIMALMGGLAPSLNRSE